MAKAICKAIRRILRRREVTRRTGASPSTQDRLEAMGKFPKRVRLSSNAVGWYEDEIAEWIESRPRGGIDAPIKANDARRRDKEADRHSDVPTIDKDDAKEAAA